MIFDCLGSADFLVPKRVAAVEAAQRALGFAAPKPQWTHGGPGQGYSVTFLRAHRSLAVSPTLLELIAPEELAPGPDSRSAIQSLAAFSALQGDRPARTHGVVVATPEIDALIERVRRDGRRHWIHEDGLGNRRLWMGATAERPGDYRPDDDAGLFLEFVPTPALRLWPATFEGDPGLPNDVAAGGLVRVAARGFLISDLNETLDFLAGAFGWECEGGIERAEDGSRRAVLAFSLPQSARIELLEPARAHPDAGALARWGPGAWQIRLAVNGLESGAEELRRRSTPFEERITGFDRPARVLRVDPAATPGCLFELAGFEAPGIP